MNKVSSIFVTTRWRRRFREWRAFGDIVAFFGKHLRKRKKRMIMAALFGIGYILMRLLEPWPLKLIFDNVLLGRPLPEPLAAILPEAGQGTLELLYILVASIVAIGLLGGFSITPTVSLVPRWVRGLRQICVSTCMTISRGFRLTFTTGGVPGI